MKSYHCVIAGNVQGIFFRSWVNDQAVALNLNGWVRNLDGKKIEILLQGSETDIEEMKSRLLVGPPLAQVTDLKCDWIDYDTMHDSFEIR